jgi:hypothetical protein
MRIAHRSRSIIATLVLFTALTAASPAGAGQFICKSRTMTSSDYASMKSSAKRAGAPHIFDWKSLHVCMNPGSGMVWLKGVHEPQADGTVHEPGTTCRRGTGPWKCEVEVARSLLTSNSIGDRQQAFKLYMPPAFAVQDARTLLARAIERARNLRAQRVCGAPEGQIPLWPADDPGWEAQIRLTPLDRPIQASIYLEAGATTVSIDDYYFEFSGTTGDVDAREFRCWGQTVVVT